MKDHGPIESAAADLSGSRIMVAIERQSRDQIKRKRTNFNKIFFLEHQDFVRSQEKSLYRRPKEEGSS